jgi:hypothetical protein
MALKQIQFQINRSQIDLEDDPESPRLRHKSCSSRQELSVAASLTLFHSSSWEKIALEVSDDLVHLVVPNPNYFVG